MSKPNLDSLLYHITLIDLWNYNEFKTFRHLIHHALYYHNQGWMVLRDTDYDTLIYAIQFMEAMEYHRRIYQLTACPNWRST